MKTTFRAMQIASPGMLELVERPMPIPGFNEVLIKIDVCGVCGADLRDCEKPQQGLNPPRIPGHEIIGHIASKGEAVPEHWNIGQRVGGGVWAATVSIANPVVMGFFICVKTR